MVFFLGENLDILIAIQHTYVEVFNHCFLFWIMYMYIYIYIHISDKPIYVDSIILKNINGLL